jgi:hypothetical protein
MSVVVRSGEQTILVDTGVGEEFHSPRRGHLASRLAAAGIDPASIHRCRADSQCMWTMSADCSPTD